MDRPALTRPDDGRLLAGVCAGLAVHLGVPVAGVRIVFAALLLASGAGGILYLWFWATVPRAGADEGIIPMRRVLTRPAADRGAAGTPGPAPSPSAAGKTSVAEPSAARTSAAKSTAQTASAPTTPAQKTHAPTAAASSVPAPSEPAPADAREPAARRPIAEVVLGASLLIAGLALVLTQLGVDLRLEVILPGLAVLVGVGLAWWQIADRDRPERNQVPRVLGALALVAVGVLMFFVTAKQPSAWTVIAAAVAVLIGVALAIAPWVLRVNRELIAERSGRAREAERAEIAAHLHDSVLQTLALIQQRSEPGSEVARLARGQERELREWLFRGADGGGPEERTEIAASLRAHAAALEAEHAVRFELVVVGSGGVAPDPIVAAAKEAMLNAARHAGGEATVYIETGQDRVSVDVTDRGPGLDPAELPEGRMGVRESILGRMERAGGTARIVPGPGGTGTSVRLTMPMPVPQDETNERAER